MNLEFEQHLKNFEALVKRVESLEKENIELRKQITILNSPTSKLPSFASIVANQKNSETENVILVKVAKEIKLKEKKENNIIITGLPRVKISTDTKTIDTESEKAILKEILDVLSVEDSTVKRFSRIKTKENRKNLKRN